MVNENEVKYLSEIKERMEKCIDGLSCVMRQKIYENNSILNYAFLDCKVVRGRPYMNIGFEVNVAQEDFFPLFVCESISRDGKDIQIFRRKMDLMSLLNKGNGIDLFKLWIEDTIERFWVMRKEHLEKYGKEVSDGCL